MALIIPVVDGAGAARGVECVGVMAQLATCGLKWNILDYPNQIVFIGITLMRQGAQTIL